jgi:signal transduction histidine kinase
MDRFAEETGELTAQRWKIGLTLYLVFSTVGCLFEWRYHPERGPLLLLLVTSQALVVAVTWAVILRWPVHPRSAWAVMVSNIALCVIVGTYNAAVAGNMLYVLLTYMGFMLVSSVFIPWGARFQLGHNLGVILAYGIGVGGGGRVGPSPAYDYLIIVAVLLFSTLGALYIDQYRRQLFAQAAALRAANDTLQAASQARTALLGGLSHDMRTPLGVLMGYADLLAESSVLADELTPSVRVIQREANQILSLVNGVLDLAQLEAGQLPFRRSIFGLALALDPLRETAEDQLRDTGICLRWTVPSTLTVDSDAGKVREIVRNLLTNAVKYTQQGEIALSAAARDGGVEIRVTDTGVGIAKEHRELIFAAFQRVGANADQRLGSVGFGLYMVRVLVGLVGGRIEVESTPGSGSTFRLWLPAQPPLAGVPNAPSAKG